jgi:hypothetical protein
MGLPLSQLVISLTYDQARDLVLSACKGLGYIIKGGPGAGGVAVGSGMISLSGTPQVGIPKVIVKIVSSGELGASEFQYSYDDSKTWSGNQTVPTSPGTYVLGTTGVNITFVPGPAGTGTSFVSNDTFTFAINIPSLPVTSWPASGGWRQLAEVIAQGFAQGSAQAAQLAAGGYRSLATGPWLDLLGENFYNLPRNKPSFTQGLVLLTDELGAGPFNISVNQMTYAATSGQLYSNTTGGTLPKNGTLILSTIASDQGASFNVGNNSIQSIVGGVLPGVSVNNSDPGNGTWITSQGADVESDDAYSLRMQQRWPALGTGSPAAAYQLWATLAESNYGHATTVTKTLVIPDPDIPGQIDIFLAGTSGGVGSQAVADVTAYILPRVTIPSTLKAQSASNVDLVVGGQVNYFASKTTLQAVAAAVAAALGTYVNSLPIGSDTTGSNSKAYYTEMEAEVGMAGAVANSPIIRDLINFSLNGGTGDIGLTIGQIAALTNNLTFNAV